MQVTKFNHRRSGVHRAAYRTESPSLPTVTLGDLLGAHKFVFSASLIGCMAIAALYSFSTTPLYQARGSVELQIPPAASYSHDGETASPVNGPSYDSYLDTQIGILQSDTLIRRVISRLQLGKRLNSIPSRGLVALRQKYLSSAGSAPVSDEQAFETAKRNLTVRQARLNNLIEILYDSPDPKISADFVNALADEYQQANLEARWQVSQSAGNWFARHLTDLRHQLEASENALQDYSRQTGMLLLSDTDKDGKGNSVGKERLSQLQEALSRAQSERILRQSQMEMATSSTPDSVPQVLDSAALKEYQIKISDLQRQLAEYKQIYTPNNPKIQNLQSQISSLESAFASQRSSVLGRLANEYKAAQRNEDMLAAEYAAQTRLVRNEDEKMIRYQTLKHDVDTNRTIYESLLQKVKETSVSVALQATSVRIVDAALPPGGQYKPNHFVNLTSGVLGGLILGAALVVVRHRSDRRVRRPGVLPHFLTTRELGVIPSGSRGATRLLTLRSRLDAIPGGELKAWLDNPNSQLSTSFRSVMTSIVFASKNPARARFAVVTSPGPGDGKTTIASNLAAVFAATGRKVLLVDADLRRPRLHKVFDRPDSPGLREFAEEVHNVGASAVQIDRFVQETAVPDLLLMPSGSSTSGAANLLHTLRFEEVFAALRGRFDTVLIDAPPLLCVPEARVMAHLADGVVLVVRSGATRVEAAMAAEEYIREDGGSIIGTVLNDAPQNASSYYSGYVSSPART